MVRHTNKRMAKGRMSERRGVMVDRREPRRDEGEEGCELLGVRGVNVVLVSWWCICWQVTA